MVRDGTNRGGGGGFISRTYTPAAEKLQKGQQVRILKNTFQPLPQRNQRLLTCQKVP